MRRIQIISFILLSLMLSACGHRKQSATAKQQKTTPQSALSVIDSLKVGDPFRLCDQVLTSIDGMLAAFPDSCENYDVEMTSVRYSFFFPEKDILPSETASRVMVRYNMTSVLNRVIHGYEWFNRMTSAMEDTQMTKADTLDLVAQSQPGITNSLLNEVLPDAKARSSAVKFLQSYKQFDGNSAENSDFAKAFQSYVKSVTEFPTVATKEMLDSLESGFWNWYDKAQFVPQIDEIIRLHLSGAPKCNLSDEQQEHFFNVIISEKDIDRRTILALEYAKFDDVGGFILLGEILESGLYTRYLLEAWISWRAHVQMCHALSSFAVIPNNYYDRMRVKCLNTLLRHYQQAGDTRDLCFIENFSCVEILHRQGSLTGNESLRICADLAYGMFIHPRITGKDSLEDE